MQFVQILFLPSLENDDDFITVANVSRYEAEAYIQAFDSLVESKRRLKSNPDAATESMDVLSGNLKLGQFAITDPDSLGLMLETLSKSNIKGFRGRRAVYLDPNTDTVAVGTTVVYNRNWATKGVSDPSILSTVLNFVEGLDEEEDEE